MPENETEKTSMAAPSLSIENEALAARRMSFVLLFWLLQGTGYVAALVCILVEPSIARPWPVVVACGLILGQCTLASAAAVFGPWNYWVRTIGSGGVVVLGNLGALVAASGRMGFPPAGEVALTSFFALLFWGVIQLPLWPLRFWLGAELASWQPAAGAPPSRAQYGIRQLMALTLGVALVLGVGRVVFPMEVLTSLGVSDWTVLLLVPSAAALISSTTILATLNPVYRWPGMAVSASASGLTAWGVYSLLAVLKLGPPGDWLAFAVVLLATYVWLQISMLIIAAAGYRIVLRR
jgi:hypothetical protein